MPDLMSDATQECTAQCVALLLDVCCIINMEVHPILLRLKLVHDKQQLC